MRSSIPLAVALACSGALGAGAETRDEVIDLARDYCYHEWTCTAGNLSVDCSDSWSSDYSEGDQIGVPYDWGGFVTLEEFDDDIADGYGAGSHSWHDVLWCTTGVDCSGFVSEVWFEPTKYGTWTLDQVSSEIDREDLLRGDALNDPGYHVMLYAHETDAGRVVFYEAAGYDVRLNANVSWFAVSGYTPIRHDGIADGTPHGTASHPFEIDAFPYERFDSTTGAGSDEFDAYGCDPSYDESGPERVYLVTLDEPGTLIATITDDVDTDVDLHLLASVDPDDCVARGDGSISEHLQPGEWILTVDTGVDGNGNEATGGYYLVVEFSAGQDPGDDDDDDDDDTGDDDDDDGKPAPRTAADYDDEQGCQCVGAASPDGSPASPMVALIAAVLLAIRFRTHRR